MRKVLACEGAGLSLNIFGWTDVGHMMHVLANYIYNLKFYWMNLVSSWSLKIKHSQITLLKFKKVMKCYDLLLLVLYCALQQVSLEHIVLWL